MFLHHDDTQLAWLQFPSFSSYSSLIHGTYTRLGGVSKGPYASLNVGANQGDEPLFVEENTTRIMSNIAHRSSLSSSDIHYVEMNQEHGTQLLAIKSQRDIERSLNAPYDALATNLPHIALVVKHADCQPIFLYDPEVNVIAAIHAGWRGIAQRITSKTIESLIDIWDVKPQRLIAGIGPSIGPKDCEFQSWREDLPPFLHRYLDADTAMLDLWQASIDELISCGVQESHIECAFLSTFALEPLFYSYRRDKITGRNASCIMLVE